MRRLLLWCPLTSAGAFNPTVSAVLQLKRVLCWNYKIFELSSAL